MTPLVLAAGAGAVGLAIVDWTAVVRGDGRLERWAKPGAIALALVTVLVAPGDRDTARALLALALVASLAGDWFLLPGGRFEVGLAAFLVAHVAYLVIFVSRSIDPSGAVVGLAIAAVVAIAVGRRILIAAARVGLGLPVAAYLVVISAMAVAATASGSILAAAGAWLFVVSDSLLGWDRFVARGTDGAAGADRPDVGWSRLAVIVTYHLAQAALIVAILTETAA